MLSVGQNLIVQVRSGGKAGASHKSYHISPLHFLPHPDIEPVKMSINGLVSEPMINDNMVAEFATGRLDRPDDPVARGINLCSRGCCKVHSRMELRYLVNRVNTIAKT